MSTMRLAGIVTDSIVDGPGLRTTVFTQGCPHHCLGCHNQHTWDFQGGYEISVADVAAKILNNPLQSGLTLSGGEPTLQAAACADLCELVKERGLNVWCYTGFTWEKIVQRCQREPDLVRLLKHVDVLVDGPFIQDLRSLDLDWRGSSNQTLIDVPARMGEVLPC